MGQVWAETAFNKKNQSIKFNLQSGHIENSQFWQKYIQKILNALPVNPNLTQRSQAVGAVASQSPQ